MSRRRRACALAGALSLALALAVGCLVRPGAGDAGSCDQGPGERVEGELGDGDASSPDVDAPISEEGEDDPEADAQAGTSPGGQGGSEPGGSLTAEDGMSSGQDAGSSEEEREPVRTYASEHGLREEAERLLSAYQRRGDCLLREAGYLDLLGRVWSCTVQGPGWVDVCFVSEDAGSGGSEVRVVRMGLEEWRRSYEGAQEQGEG